MDSVENEENKQKEQALDRQGFKNEGVDIIGEPVDTEPESLEQFSQDMKTVASSLEQQGIQTTPRQVAQEQQAQQFQPKIVPPPKQPSSQAEEEGYIEVPGGSTFGEKSGTLESEIAQVLQDAEKPTPQKQALPINNPGIKPLRTYKSDTEEAIQNQRMSVVTIAVAESKKKENRGEKMEIDDKVHVPYGTLFTSLFLIALGTGAFYFVYLKKVSPIAPVAYTQNQTGAEIIKSRKTEELDLSLSENLMYDFALKASGLQGTVVGDIIRINPISETTAGKTTLSAQMFFERATPSIPGKVSRSLSKDFMLGVHVFDGPTPFILLKTTFFQNAFAGMLEWESSLPKDLAPLIALSHGEAKVGTFFVDMVVKNKDVRVVRGSEGQDLLFYTFVNKDTILITTKRLTLEELIARLTTTTVVR